jgi:hypothetical protein
MNLSHAAGAVAESDGLHAGASAGDQRGEPDQCVFPKHPVEDECTNRSRASPRPFYTSHPVTCTAFLVGWV